MRNLFDKISQICHRIPRQNPTTLSSGCTIQWFVILLCGRTRLYYSSRILYGYPMYNCISYNPGRGCNIMLA